MNQDDKTTLIRDLEEIRNDIAPLAFRTVGAKRFLGLEEACIKLTDLLYKVRAYPETPDKEDTKPPRKVRQILCRNGEIIALCDDESVWGFLNGAEGWIKFPDFPEDE